MSGQRENRRVLPRPGETHPGFVAEPARCWRLVYSQQLQATHCTETLAWTGGGSLRKGDRWFRVWACPGQLEGPTGLRQFGGYTSAGPGPSDTTRD